MPPSPGKRKVFTNLVFLNIRKILSCILICPFSPFQILKQFEIDLAEAVDAFAKEQDKLKVMKDENNVLVCFNHVLLAINIESE